MSSSCVTPQEQRGGYEAPQRNGALFTWDSSWVYWIHHQDYLYLTGAFPRILVLAQHRAGFPNCCMGMSPCSSQAVWCVAKISPENVPVLLEGSSSAAG